MREAEEPSLALPSGIAVDFGGTKISAARVANGAIVDFVKTRTDGKAGPDAQVEEILALLDRLELDGEEPVGVAVAGRVNREGTWYAVNTETLTQVTEVHLRSILERRLSRPVVVQNDAIAAAQGEFVAGSARGCESAGYLTISTGVGGGLILDGRPVISTAGLAGHVGFTTSRVSEGTCGCGRERTVENIAGGRAIAAQAAAAGHPGIDAKAVYEAKLAGEEWAISIIRRSASAVAELCANLKSLLDLERIVIGGSIGLAEGYLDEVRTELAKEPEIFRLPLVSAALGENSALVGVLSR